MYILICSLWLKFGQKNCLVIVRKWLWSLLKYTSVNFRQDTDTDRNREVDQAAGVFLSNMFGFIDLFLLTPNHFGYVNHLDVSWRIWERNIKPIMAANKHFLKHDELSVLRTLNISFVVSCRLAASSAPVEASLVLVGSAAGGTLWRQTAHQGERYDEWQAENFTKWSRRGLDLCCPSCPEGKMCIL